MRKIGLNQTFEGLKYDKVIAADSEDGTFESDLWGIEIDLVTRVNIVNELFESDLWGIEIWYWDFIIIR